MKFRNGFPFVADPDKKLYEAFGVEASIMSALNPKAWPAAVKGLFVHPDIFRTKKLAAGSEYYNTANVPYLYQVAFSRLTSDKDRYSL